ncbi:nuclear transport factor 2 family protein [Pseudogemmatithrix spongiicola]|uniref:Nuclear transport factor 2 family protein n=1 Tax=Pseudogemmatithrix spongiicola TaxID=3062599 RepID=A0AA49JZH8_9BACT|nr:nuclear transport factor 2 family protein [Gemmatimonadaceae bacterium 'strain 138']WKW14811.1 nuclear transport factor 2 family protein [Gemmatimonadaceae bacterium 'strain 318']
MSGISRRLAVAVAMTVALAGRANAQDHAHAGHQATPSAEVASVIQAIQALFAAAERGDLAALDSIYAGDSLLVIEGSGINRGWTDYRDNHLAPELKEFSNFRYRPFEIEARVSGNLAWATFRYALSADLPNGKADVVGRGTAILERRGARWVVRLTHTASRARRPSDPPMP